MDTAKIFESGNSQAIRLPKEYRFDTTKTKELVIRRSGDMLILTPKEKLWENFLKAREFLSDDFFAEGREQGVQAERDWDALNEGRDFSAESEQDSEQDFSSGSGRNSEQDSRQKSNPNTKNDFEVSK